MKNQVKMTAGSVMEIEENTHCYPDFLNAVKKKFAESEETTLFTTDGSSLFAVFIKNLPPADQQHYNCRACRQFIERFGGLVSITERGETRSALWNERAVPEFFRDSVAAMRKAVEHAEVTGVFISGAETLGNPLTKGWSHLSVCLPKKAIFTSRLKISDQVAAGKKEEFRLLAAGLAEYPLDTARRAVTILKAEALYRSGTCLGVAEWLVRVHIRREWAKTGVHKRNVIWAESAVAPVGYCHVRSTMIGTLLDDLGGGLPFDSVKRRFAEKMDPTRYLRPQAPPTEGNIREAEKIVEKLELQPSLERRFARLEELNLLWQPAGSERKAAGSGIFSHLQTKKKAPQTLGIPAVTMTWRKFSEEVLPAATRIEYLVREGKANYSGLLTAVHADAPPIMQWDYDHQRNPFSWYVYKKGSDYRQWGLKAGYCEVTGICLQPSMWYGEHLHRGKSVFILLKEAQDKNPSGNMLFPEMLKSELHGIRATVEAYSQSAQLQGQKEASACGLKLESDGRWNAMLRVTTDTGVLEYQLDRWD